VKTYTCIACNRTFEVQATHRRPRCPHCETKVPAFDLQETP
jgi:DNA-directed RNA polymerase subunit RPC12/RpoP